MSAVALAVACFLAALVATGLSMVAVSYGHRLARSLDETLGGPQKIHQTPVPRVGGISIAAGLIVAGLVATLIRGRAEMTWTLLLCIAPGFTWGLIEDISKRGSVFARLAITACSAMLAFVLLDARITELGIRVIDSLLLFPVISFIFTVVAVTGVGHAMNVIDGLNGLSGMTAVMASAGLAAVASIVGDGFILFASCALCASVLGFLILNYPRGRIFLGDGGAYLIGLILGELSVLLVQRNPAVSPWFPLVLLAYPIWETLFSMYRRRKRRVSTGHADALHLHSLLYKRVVRCVGGATAHSARRNSVASLMLWILPGLCFLAAVLLWQRTIALQAAALAFAALYVLLYRRIVRFRLPKQLIIRLHRDGGPSFPSPLSTARR